MGILASILSHSHRRNVKNLKEFIAFGICFEYSDVLSMDVLGFHCGSKGIDTVLAVHVVASEEVARECSKVDVVVGSLHNTLMLAESLQQ